MVLTNELGGKAVFLVEDEYLVALSTGAMLTRLGATVTTAYRCDEALTLARSEKFDAAILDVNLAGERSAPVAEVLSARGIPYILATGYSRRDLDLNDDTEIIDKPYTPQKLADGLRRIMNAASE